MVAEKQLYEIVSNCGFEKMSFPGDGDCCFTLIFFVLDKVLNGNNAVLQQSLTILKNQDIPDRNILLRQLVVENGQGSTAMNMHVF